MGKVISMFEQMNIIAVEEIIERLEKTQRDELEITEKEEKEMFVNSVGYIMSEYLSGNIEKPVMIFKYPKDNSIDVIGDRDLTDKEKQEYVKEFLEDCLT